MPRSLHGGDERVKIEMKRLIQACIAGFQRFLCAQEFASRTHRLVDDGLLVLGRHTYGTPTVWNYRGSEHKVVIGSFCSIAPGVQIITGGVHPTEWVSTFPFRAKWNLEGAYKDGMPSSRGDVVIGSDVWLGTDVMIFSGVQIGHGSVIAARSIVTQNVPAYSIAAGNPAKVVRTRFEPDIIEAMLRIAWWDWDDARILEAVPLLSSDRIEEFIRAYDNP